MTIRQLEAGEAKVENQYARIVRDEGNLNAQKVIYEVFEVIDRLWRGMDIIPMSRYAIKEKYAHYDDIKKFKINIIEVEENPECIAGEIMKGIKKPFECLQFGKNVLLLTPLALLWLVVKAFAPHIIIIQV